MALLDNLAYHRCLRLCYQLLRNLHHCTLEIYHHENECTLHKGQEYHSQMDLQNVHHQLPDLYNYTHPHLVYNGSVFLIV